MQEENMTLFHFGNLKDYPKTELTWYQRRKVSCTGPCHQKWKKRSYLSKLVLLLLFPPFYHAEQKHRSTKISSLCPKEWCLKGITQRKGGIYFLSRDRGLLESASTVLFTWTVKVQEVKQCWKEWLKSTLVFLPLCFNICPLSADLLPLIQDMDICWSFR